PMRLKSRGARASKVVLSVVTSRTSGPNPTGTAGLINSGGDGSLGAVAQPARATKKAKSVAARSHHMVDFDMTAPERTYLAGMRMGAPLFFRRSTTNLAGLVELALRPMVCTSCGPS